MNPALEGVDPFDPNLTAEQKAAALNECRINPEYFLENCVRKSLVPREDWDDNQRFTDYVNTLSNLPIEPSISRYWIATLPVRRQRQGLVRKVRRSLDVYFAYMEMEEKLRYGLRNWIANDTVKWDWAVVEGTVDYDPQFIDGFVSKFHDTVFDRFVSRSVAGPVPLEGEFIRQGEGEVVRESTLDQFVAMVESHPVSFTVDISPEKPAIEGELVDKGVEVQVYRDRFALDAFLSDNLNKRREAKKEIVANNYALEGEFVSAPPIWKGLDIMALAVRAQKNIPIEGELIKARDPAAGNHKLEDLSGRNGLKHAIQELETAMETPHEISPTPSSAL